MYPFMWNSVHMAKVMTTANKNNPMLQLEDTLLKLGASGQASGIFYCSVLKLGDMYFSTWRMDCGGLVFIMYVK